MIKGEKCNVTIIGSKEDVATELYYILRKTRECIGEDKYNRCIDAAQKSEKEIIREVLKSITDGIANIMNEIEEESESEDN